jgi:FMN phosphatase YigB (HAD superfamily)
LIDSSVSDTEAMALLRQCVAKAGVRVSDQAMQAAEAFAIESFAPHFFEAILFKLVNRDSTLALKCAADFRKQFKPKFAARPDAREILAKLKDSGLKLAIVNRLSAEENEVLTKAGVLDLMNFKGLSAAMKIEIPDMRVFEFVLGNLGVGPADCAFIGARLDNCIRPGNELHIKTVLFKVGLHGTRQLPRDLRDVPGYEIDKLENLGAVLQEMN